MFAVGCSPTEKRIPDIQRANEDDAPQISALYGSIWGDFRGKLPKDLIRSREPSAEQMRHWLREDTYFIARKDGKIIGVVGASLKHGTCLLTHMAVDKAYRRKGVGTALAETVIAYAKACNTHKVWLDTSPQLTEAIAIYRKLGFVKCGHLEKHFWGALKF